MKKFALSLILSVSAAISVVAQEADGEADALAREVWQASGGESWAKVKALRFTFVVEEGGNQLASVEHHWDLRAGTDRVKWKGKDVTVNLASPPQDEDAKAAYARWVNDSYWLLAPLKVLDPGVKRSYEGQKESEGVTGEALRLNFGQVGLTPGDQYVLYIDPATKLVRAWDYIPDAQTTMHATWEKYQSSGGLQLSTKHHFGGKTIRFADVEVSTD